MNLRLRRDARVKVMSSGGGFSGEGGGGGCRLYCRMKKN